MIGFPQKLPAVELISVHVPKTGGTTFSSILAEQYRKAVFSDYEHEPIHPEFRGQNLDAWRSEQTNKAAKLPPETQVIHGHFWAGKYDHIFPAARKITWLRDPVRRLISHYYYFRGVPSMAHPIHRLVKEKNLSLKEFARLPALQNVLTRRWLRDTPLSAFSFVGILEHFQEDLGWLQRELGWKTIEAPIENRTLHQEYEGLKMDSAALQELEHLNAADMELYRQAVALRSRRRVS